jgi:hypothetical protein
MPSTASAAATFDPDSGTGFVGKGDVQTPFGWNNDLLQKNASGVNFRYKDRTTYDVTCEQETKESFTTTNAKGVVKTHTRTVTVTAVVDATTAVVYDATTSTKKNPKGSVVGFSITGTSPVTAERAPQVGDTCEMDDGTDGTVSATTQTSTDDSDGDTLSATHASKSPAVVWTDGVSTLL